MLGEALGEIREVQTDRIIVLAREQADHLDQCLDSTLMVVAEEGLRKRYLAIAASRLRAYDLGYFATRNLEVEGRCHEAILAACTGGDLLTSEAGRELLSSCDNYSSEMVSALRAFPT